ncbi:MAG: SIMPL domain-containing protein [Flavobacterium sp.]
MKKALIAFLLICTIPSFSQTGNGNEITAEGYSKTKVKPDLANFKISVEKRNTTEKTAIKELNEEIEKVQKVLLRIGFTEKNIRISDYQVSSSENNDDKKEYTATNTLIVNFVLDNKIIEAFYQEIQNDNIKDSDIQFDAQVSEELEKATRQKLVQLAIADAKSNAENIAKALEVKINNVKQVSKFSLREGVANIKADAVKYNRPMMAPMIPKTSFAKFEVEEKELEETITIVYEIVKK